MVSVKDHKDIRTEADLAVFNKIVITALKFTPVVVSHHLPYKVMPTGKV
jgi:hypothetical protein